MTADATTRAVGGGADLDDPPPPPPPVAEDRPARRWLTRLPRYTWSGTVGALVLGCCSLTPSLLPRGWVVQGLITGITAAIGYGLGVTVAWFVAEFTERRLSPSVRRRTKQKQTIAGPVLCLVLL